jgi:hypothetical protein
MAEDTIANVIALLEEAQAELIDIKDLIDDDAMLALIRKISELGHTMRLCTSGCSDAVHEALEKIETVYATAIKLKVVS